MSWYQRRLEQEGWIRGDEPGSWLWLFSGRLREPEDSEEPFVACHLWLTREEIEMNAPNKRQEELSVILQEKQHAAALILKDQNADPL